MKNDENHPPSINFTDHASKLRKGELQRQRNTGRRPKNDAEPGILPSPFSPENSAERRAYIEAFITRVALSESWNGLVLEARNLNATLPEDAIAKAVGALYDSVGGKRERPLEELEKASDEGLVKGLKIMLSRLTAESRTEDGNPGSSYFPLR